MTAQEIIRAVRADFELFELSKKIRAGKATFADTSRYSERSAVLIGEKLTAILPDLPEGEREELCRILLEKQFEDINKQLADVQAVLDEAQGLHLAPQKAPFPAERVQKVAQSLADVTVPVETVQRRARSATATVAKSFHDDYMRENAKFRSKAGLKCFIKRSGSASCCSWCSEVMGTFEFGDEPEGVFRRHDNCDCTVIYGNQVLRGKYADDGSHRTKAWEEIGETPTGFKPTVFTDENRPVGFQPKVLTNGSDRDTMDLGITFARSKQPNRRIGSDGQQIIDKPTYQRLTRDFLKRGGIIQNDQEAIEHLEARHVHAEYLPSFNTILFSNEPTVSDVLEELYHAEQDRLHMFGEQVTTEVLLRREIDAQHYLLSMTEKYKIPTEEVELTKANLADYEQQLTELLNAKGGE